MQQRPLFMGWMAIAMSLFEIESNPQCPKRMGRFVIASQAKLREDRQYYGDNKAPVTSNTFEGIQNL